jgi:glycosyltransferase involved in cell wall biosynthesis
MMGRRVLHLATSLDFGGVETHLETIARARGEARYEPVFCAIAGGGAAATSIAQAGAQVTCLGLPAAIPSPRAIVALARLMRRLRPDVLHAHGAEANFHGLPAAAMARVPVRIGEEIGIPEHGRLARLGFSTSYRFAHAVIGVSAAVTRWLVDSGEVPAGKAVTLLNPVQLPPGRNGAVPPLPLRFCHVGRLEAVKNLPALLAAFASLSAPHGDAELWLVGDGSMREALQRQAAALGIAARVRVTGFDPDPARWLRQCHVAVQSSLSEGFGLAMVEAMGCELPVLSTPVGAAPELIADGRTGWLADGCDEAALRAGLQRAAACTPEVLAAMGRSARQAVHRMFTPTDYLARVETLYAAPGAARGDP